MKIAMRHAVALVVARLQVVSNGAGQVVVAKHLDADIRRRRARKLAATVK